MQTEKLDLLEKRLGIFVARFNELTEENKRLRQSLEGQAARLREMEEELGRSHLERERFRDRLDRIIAVVEQLELLQEHEAGEGE